MLAETSLNSEMRTNLLIDIGSNFRNFSECALKSLPDPLDFDPHGAVSDADLLAEYCEALVAVVPAPAKKSA